jgi:hypothetical protein
MRITRLQRPSIAVTDQDCAGGAAIDTPDWNRAWGLVIQTTTA